MVAAVAVIGIAAIFGLLGEAVRNEEQRAEGEARMVEQRRRQQEEAAPMAVERSGQSTSRDRRFENTITESISPSGLLHRSTSTPRLKPNTAQRISDSPLPA